MTFLPDVDRRYLDERNFEYEEAEDGATKALIIRGCQLPDGRFDHSKVDLLIIIPSNYPDCAPNMFHTLPWVKLAATATFPRQAHVSVTFASENWQRWSRHNNDWRPGVDGIWTMLKRVEHALEIAA